MENVADQGTPPRGGPRVPLGRRWRDPDGLWLVDFRREPMGSLDERLTTQRRRCFVGRAAETELFRVALGATEAPFAVLHVHGPGGLGKTTLLDLFARLGEEAGAHVIRFDGRSLVPSPASVLNALPKSFEIPEDDAQPISSERLVLLIDSYERLAPVDDWLRTWLLPRLPADALTVIAGRTPPTAAWRADPAWRDLLRVVTLRNLDPEDCRAYLEAHRIPAALYDRLLAVSHGHPLGLSLLVDLISRGGEAGVDPLTPDLVATLLQRFVDTVPSGPQRRALEVCGLARVTTESLLRAAVGSDDAHELFGWLQQVSFIESGSDGVFPHDLARDVLDADLRWRDPEAYQKVFRNVTAHVRSRLRSSQGPEQLRTIRDLKFLFRNLPGILSPVDWNEWGHHDPEPARPADRPAVLELVARTEGADSAAIAARWWERQPDGFFVLRGSAGLRGVIALLDLTAASDDDRAADPGAQAAWHHARRHAPLRAGERVTQTRFVIDEDAYQAPSSTMNGVPLLTLQRYLGTPALAWDFLTLFEPEPYNDFFAMADLPRAAGADFDVGGRRYGLFAHDFRQVPIDTLIGRWIERSLAQGFVPAAPAPSAPMLVLSQQDFAGAVRQALRDLHQPQLLARNLLQRARLVRDRIDGHGPDPAALAELLRGAIDMLRRHPRDHKRLQALERTYLNPAPTQEIAAERLGLPFSTYRRHLTQGMDRIVDWLWEQEIHGREHG